MVADAFLGLTGGADQAVFAGLYIMVGGNLDRATTTNDARRFSDEPPQALNTRKTHDPAVSRPGPAVGRKRTVKSVQVGRSCPS